MKKYLFWLGLLAGVAQAAEWQALRLNDPNLHSIDQSRILIDGTVLTYWRKVVFSSPQVVRQGQAASGLFRERLDCTQHSLLTLNWVLFDRLGQPLDQSTGADKEATTIMPDSLADQLEVAMCRLIGQKRQPVTTSRPDTASPAQSPTVEPATPIENERKP
ncbi:hypothetical protein HNQ59_002757 [Chitinivorax tropicus]|uniref:Surface-adhesin protein E-like domain-containing protein n=1 Tax=Chitinivorax tropicus TaxID=714531 RepID=A0A840MPS9_9PROT|nr:surface-adhesin E family protein [Chitinivorax tropicus]MBB5019455.1 hypothetical protein [Chitinivorax tropicus]